MKFYSILLILVTILPACAQTGFVNHVKSDAFHKLMTSKEVILLDVRTPQEYANGHIKGAGQLNYYEKDFRSRLLLLPKDQPILVYCRTGSRSRGAADYLVKNGYTQVYNLQRGIMEWTYQNRSLVVESSAKTDQKNSMTQQQFNDLIAQEEIVFIDFYAPWCSPCRKMMPMIDNLKKKYSNRIKVVKINADASKQLIQELPVTSIPYLVLYKNQKLVYEKEGMASHEELVSVLNNHLNAKN